jgi:Flp pilus assembly pilin Flp
MPSAPDLSQQHADAAFPVESNGSRSTSVADEVLVSNAFSRCRALLRRTRRSVERGATAVEYALMVGLIAVGIVAAVSSLRDKTTDSLNQTSCSTRGLIFPPRVKAGDEFKVKYIRNDTGIGGWTSVGATGANHGQIGAVKGWRGVESHAVCSFDRWNSGSSSSHRRCRGDDPRKLRSEDHSLAKSRCSSITLDPCVEKNCDLFFQASL